LRFLKQKTAVSSVAMINGGKMVHRGNSGISGEDVGVGVGVFVGSSVGVGEGVDSGGGYGGGAWRKTAVKVWFRSIIKYNGL
jgi:hypothetical protein